MALSGSVNKAILLGNLGKDPESRVLSSGSTVCKFSLATSESYLKDGERVETTEWHNIVVWGKQGEACSRYLQKGRPVYVEGRIQTRSWDDGATGEKKYMTEIVASKVVFLGGRDGGSGRPSGGTGSSAHGRPANEPGNYSGPDDSDIPF